MKIPLIWLKDYINLNKTKKQFGDDFTAIGLMVDKPTQEEVLDLEHRMDRSDWLSILGCARDICAYNKVPLIEPQVYNEDLNLVSSEDKIEIQVEARKKVNRFKTVVIKNVTVGPSPDWIKQRLELYGIPSINNVVDITNFVMVEMGQPMHAQDIQNLPKNEIILKDADVNKTITTLLGENVKLVEENFTLSSNDEPLVIGGIVGGKKTAVTEQTKNIILDAGNYNQDLIRKASRKLKIQNETVLRYDKFLNPNNIDIAINRAIKLILDTAGGEVYLNDDWYPKKVQPISMNLNILRIKQLSGLDYDLQLILQTLTNLGYQIVQQIDDQIELIIPLTRTDIQVEDDIVADILRINDYQNIPAKHINKVPPKEITSEIYMFEDKIKDILVNLKLHEHITDPLIDKSLIQQQQIDNTIVLANPLTSEKSALRTNIKDTLSKVYETYKKNKISNIGIFEIGKVYSKTIKNDYTEQRQLQIIYHNTGVPLKQSAEEFKSILSRLLNELGINWVTASKIWQIDPISVSINTNELLKITEPSNRVITQIKNYSSIDFSIIAKNNFKFIDLYHKIQHTDFEIVSINVLEQVLIDNQNKSILFRVTYKNIDNSNLHQEIVNIISKIDDISLRV